MRISFFARLLSTPFDKEATKVLTRIAQMERLRLNEAGQKLAEYSRVTLAVPPANMCLPGVASLSSFHCFSMYTYYTPRGSIYAILNPILQMVSQDMQCYISTCSRSRLSRAVPKPFRLPFSSQGRRQPRIRAKWAGLGCGSFSKLVTDQTQRLTCCATRKSHLSFTFFDMIQNYLSLSREVHA